MEAEVIPLFMIGCTLVLLFELVVGIFILKLRRTALLWFLLQWLFMGVAWALFFFVMITMTVPKYDHSVNVGLIGVSWAAHAVCLLATLYCTIPHQKKTKAKDYTDITHLYKN